MREREQGEKIIREGEKILERRGRGDRERNIQSLIQFILDIHHLQNCIVLYILYKSKNKF